MVVVGSRQPDSRIVAIRYQPLDGPWNVSGVVGPVGVLEKLFSQMPMTGFPDPEPEPAPPQKRGRTSGSTNWTRERFWRQYTRAVQDMRRPYRRTHLAARIELSYGTFVSYLNRWGPPPGIAAPGD